MNRAVMGCAAATIVLLLLTGCDLKSVMAPAPPAPASTASTPAPSPQVQVTEQSLAEARRGFTTTLTRQEKANEPVPEPPPSVFRLVQYDSAVGKLAAYLTPDPGDGRKHPAIVWITGGDCNTIGNIWDEAPRENDQTASAFREAGIVMMFPSLRGGNENPGFKESFFGEVEDVVAAAEFLAAQTYIDPQRIYLGGHSTGGALVMLVAEYSDRFRATFSFGPAAEISGYGPDFIPFDETNRREIELRAPYLWMKTVNKPLFVIEGDDQGNLESLQIMADSPHSAMVRFFAVQGADHFSLLAPMNELIAAKILRDDGPTSNIDFSEPGLIELGRLE